MNRERASLLPWEALIGALFLAASYGLYCAYSAAMSHLRPKLHIENPAVTAKLSDAPCELKSAYLACLSSMKGGRPNVDEEKVCGDLLK